MLSSAMPVPRFRHPAILLFLLVTSCLCQVQSQTSPALVFLHVTVINPGNSSVEADRAVVVSGGRILTVAAGK